MLAAAKPARQRAPAPLTVAFRGSTADGLRRVALARQESPQVLAAALIERLFETGEAETMLGAARSEDLTDGQGRRPFEGIGDLTIKQCAVLYLLGGHGAGNHGCSWSAAALAKLMPSTVTPAYVRESFTALARKGLIRIGPELGTAPRVITFTEAGLAVFSELLEERDG